MRAKKAELDNAESELQDVLRAPPVQPDQAVMALIKPKVCDPAVEAVLSTFAHCLVELGVAQPAVEHVFQTAARENAEETAGATPGPGVPAAQPQGEALPATEVEIDDDAMLDTLTEGGGVPSSSPLEQPTPAEALEGELARNRARLEAAGAAAASAC